jgi:hypothetical protein
MSEQLRPILIVVVDAGGGYPVSVVSTLDIAASSTAAWQRASRDLRRDALERQAPDHSKYRPRYCGPRRAAAR